MMKLSHISLLSRADRRAVLFLMGFALLVLVIIVALGGGETETPLSATDSLGQHMERQGNRRWTAFRDYDRRSGYGYYATGKGRATSATLFPFDPNTADSTALLRLGLRPWQVRSIYKYRAAGGVYRRPQDFARLYGLTQQQYRRLEPYIRIANDYRPAAELYAGEHSPSHPTADTLQRHWTRKLGPNEHVSLNSADTTALKRVPGIGSYFARRIVSYRQRLGGFYSAQQLLEIDNFPTEALPYLQVDDHIRRMNVNKLSLSELKRHPYINYYQAKDITDYRRLHGPLRSLDDVRLTGDFTQQDFERLRHYVEF